MSFALALQQNWLSKDFPDGPFKFTPLQTFENLRNAVNKGDADFFMWEHFTSKKYYDNGEIKRIGEIYTPWSSWKIVASTTTLSLDVTLENLFVKLDKGIEYFEKNHEEAVEYISTSLDYSVADARSWLKTVKFCTKTKGVDTDVIQSTIDLLKKARVVGETGMKVRDMIVFPRDKASEQKDNVL